MTKPTEEILLNDRNDGKGLDANTVACHVREMIKIIGEDPNREGLRKTPERFEKAFKFLTAGYTQTSWGCFTGGRFRWANAGRAFVKATQFFSLCEHLLVAF